MVDGLQEMATDAGRRLRCAATSPASIYAISFTTEMHFRLLVLQAIVLYNACHQFYSMRHITSR